MRLEIPYFIQEGDTDCGIATLRMTLAYLGKDEGTRVLEDKTGIKSGKGIFTIQLATAASLLGYKTDFYSKSILFDEEHLKQEFYKKYADDMNLEKSKRLILEAKKSGVNTQEKTLPLEELLRLVTHNSVPIVLLDWNIAMGRENKGYQGHFVPICGYDERNVYVHNPGNSGPQEFMKISRETFDRARKANGTDEDLVIIYRKQP